MNGEKKKASVRRGTEASAVTLRFAIDLAKPNEESTTNEFSYELLRKRELEEKKDGKQCAKLELSAEDSFPQDSADKLAGIAKRFEDKYGPKRRKRFAHEADLIDRGSGYDISDSFVDDRELYEDYVPHQLDTRFGGFYVNMGCLEFKPAEDMENQKLDFITSKKTSKPPKTRKSFQTPQAILASQKLKKAKQHAALQKCSVGSGMKKLQATKLAVGVVVGGGVTVDSGATFTKPPPLKKPKLIDQKSLLPSNGKSVNTDSLENRTPMDVKLSLPLASGNSQIPMVISMVNLSPNLNKKPANVVILGETLSEGQTLQVPKEPPVLPNKLPSMVLERVTELEQLIMRDQGSDGKLSNKARMSYDKHLVNIHLSCQGLSIRIRNAIFDYLAYKMSVSRGTLVKRMKQDLRKREEVELEKCILDLKRAIDAAIPEQLEAYMKELKARAESINCQPFSEKLMNHTDDESHVDDVFDDSTVNSGSGQLLSSSQDKSKRAPRKRFRWTDELRRLLCVVVKVMCEEKCSGANKGNGEEIISTFLEDRVKPLWPKGWMQKSILYKTSEVAHKYFTSAEPKKAVALLKKDKPLIILKDQSSPIISTSIAVTQTRMTPKALTAQSLQSFASPSSCVTLNSKLSSTKKELDALKCSSQNTGGGITSGGLGPGILVTDRKRKLFSANPTLPKSDLASSLKLANTDHPGITVKPSSPSSITSLGTLHNIGSTSASKLLHMTTTEAVVKTVASKTNKMTLHPETTTSKNAVTYVLSTNSIDVSQLIQSHLQKQQKQLQSSGTTVSSSSQRKGSAQSGQLLSTSSGSSYGNSTSGGKKIQPPKKQQVMFPVSGKSTAVGLVPSLRLTPVIQTTSNLGSSTNASNSGTTSSTSACPPSAKLESIMSKLTSNCLSKSGTFTTSGLNKLESLVNMLAFPSTLLSASSSAATSSALATNISPSTSTMKLPLSLKRGSSDLIPALHCNIKKPNQRVSSPQVSRAQHSSSSACGGSSAGVSVIDVGGGSSVGVGGVSSAGGRVGVSSVVGRGGVSSAVGRGGVSSAVGRGGVSSAVGRGGVSSAVGRGGVSNADVHGRASVSSPSGRGGVSSGVRGRGSVSSGVGNRGSVSSSGVGSRGGVSSAGVGSRGGVSSVDGKGGVSSADGKGGVSSADDRGGMSSAGSRGGMISAGSRGGMISAGSRGGAVSAGCRGGMSIAGGKGGLSIAGGKGGLSSTGGRGGVSSAVVGGRGGVSSTGVGGRGGVSSVGGRGGVNSAGGRGVLSSVGGRGSVSSAGASGRGGVSSIGGREDVSSVGSRGGVSSSGVSVIDVGGVEGEGIRCFPTTGTSSGQILPATQGSGKSGGATIVHGTTRLPPLISTTTATSTGGGVKSTGIVQDTPPQILSLATTSAITAAKSHMRSCGQSSVGVQEQLFIPLSLSPPQSPLKSPMEQILGEHSYLASSSP